MRRLVGLLTVVVFVLVVSAPAASAAPIPSTQDPNQAPAFIGAPAVAQPLPKPPKFDPEVSGLHGDGGNTKTFATPGPLGVSPVVQTVVGTPLFPFMWDRSGRLTTACVLPAQITPTGKPLRCLAAVDPTSLTVLSQWIPPVDQDLNPPYANETSDGRVLITSQQGHVYVVQRSDATSPPSFTVLRDIDLVALGVLDGQRPLLAASFDGSGNIWFTTGGIVGIGHQPGTSTTLGFIDRSATAHSIELPNQIVENGLAVNDAYVFVSTGPAGAADVADATGHTYAFEATRHGVRIVWQQTYNAGSSTKPGGFARGSGATPTLLGDRATSPSPTTPTRRSRSSSTARKGPIDSSSVRCPCSPPAPAPTTSGWSGCRTDRRTASSSSTTTTPSRSYAHPRTPPSTT